MAGALLGIALSVAALQTPVWAASDEEVDVDAAAVAGTLTLSPAMPLLGGSGTVSFDNSVPVAGTGCAMVSADGPAPGETEPPLPGVLDAEAGRVCSLSISGATYATLVCGVGDIEGTATLAEPASSDSYTMSFGIDFTGGIGIFTGVAGESEPEGTDPAAVYGVVLLVPVSVPSASACASRLELVGTLVTDT